jgi:hypothetical protein
MTIDEISPHYVSQVLTGAIFDLWCGFAKGYVRDRKHTVSHSLWSASGLTERLAIQPLDLLPPVDVTFRDYARAVCRSQEISEPTDPQNHLALMVDIFRRRKIFSAADARTYRERRHLFDSLSLSVEHSIEDIARSRASAYRFLDDNRKDLLIPANRDFFIADLYDAKKIGARAEPLPRQIVLQYVWREEVALEGSRFEHFAGRMTTMLCGGTLVFDEDGRVISWARKPGALPYGGRRGGDNVQWRDNLDWGSARRRSFLDNVATHIAMGRIGRVTDFENDSITARRRLIIAADDGEFVTFMLSHRHAGDPDLPDDGAYGEAQLEISM